jgi:hypothetical protein
MVVITTDRDKNKPKKIKFTGKVIQYRFFNQKYGENQNGAILK